MEIEKIEENSIFLNDGGLRALIRVDPINFTLLDNEQKKALVQNYREFLNHLNYPVQVLVKTSIPDLTGYFKEAKQQIKDSPTALKKLFEDFVGYEKAFLKANNIRERSYYLVISHEAKSHLKKDNLAYSEALKRLDQKVKIASEKIEACGLKTRRLKTDEIIDAFVQFGGQDPLPKGKTAGKFNISEITPIFDIQPSFAVINSEFHRTIKATGFPRSVEDGWLENFMSTSEPYDLSLHIHPATISSTLVALHNQIIKQTSDLISSTSSGTPNPALEIKRQDTLNVYQQLYKGEEKMFQVSLYVDNQAHTLAGLDLLTEKAKANLNSLLIIPKTLDFRLADGYKCLLPIAKDAVGVRKEFLTSSLSATFPFLYPVDSNKRGLFFAHEKNTLNPLFIDFDAMSNKHFFVLGISGSGKSYSSKFLLLQHMLANRGKVFILDPNSEYAKLTKKLDGEVITLSKDSSTIINLFDLAGEDFGGKMLSLISVFDIITGGLTENQKGVLNEALTRVYAHKGIKSSDPTTWRNNPPTFSDLKAILDKMAYEFKIRRSLNEEKSLEVLVNRVRMYAKSGFFGFLDRETKVDLKNSMIDFDLNELPPQVKQLVMFSVLEMISREIKKDKNPKIVLIDEGWSLLRSKEAENYVLEFIKTSRKFNTAIGFITQEIEDLLRSDGGISILNTTSTKILLKQNASNLGLISKTLALNEKERDYLLRADKGQGLLITEQGRYQFVVKAPNKIHSFITTDPNEEESDDDEPIPEEWTRLKLDRSRNFFELKSLSEEQAEFLKKEGYIAIRSMLLNPSGLPYYLVRTQSNESAEHALIAGAIAEEIKKRGGKPILSATVGADVEFEIKGKKIAFEVETGEYLDSFGEQGVIDKLGKQKLKYDELIVVVTDRLRRAKYAKLAKTTAITRTQVGATLDSVFRRA